MTSAAIDYLVVGHVTADLLPNGGMRPGGTALYAGLTAACLGLRTAIFTAYGHDLDLGWLPPEITTMNCGATASTTFSNSYVGSQRVQRLHRQAPPLPIEQIPAAWRAAPVVHLGPVVHELPDRAPQFPGSLVGATPQGWMRRWNAAGLVSRDERALDRLVLPGVRVIVLSEEDVAGDEAPVLTLAQRVEIVVLTRAERGATVFCDGRATDVPAAPATVVDPTGAGDTFAAALLVGLHHGLTPVAATQRACCVAACAIEAVGVAALLDPAAFARHLALKEQCLATQPT